MAHHDGAGEALVTRARDLARGGHCPTLTDLAVALEAEGFDHADAALGDPQLRAELRLLSMLARRAVTARRTGA